VAHFTDEEVRILNEWARTQPALRKAFPYTNSSDNGRGLGDLLQDHDGAVEVTLTVDQTNGAQSFTAVDRLRFHSDDFYIKADSNGNPIVNWRGEAGGGGGVTDHGLLDSVSLLDDDHPQYLLRTETPPGFYGIVVRESDGTFIERDDTIEFLSTDFDLSTVNSKPRVALGKIHTAEAFYLAGNGNIYNDDSGNIIVDVNGEYMRINNNLIAGNPGGEGDSISVHGFDYTSALKVSDISQDDAVSLHLHKHSGNLPCVIMGSRSDALGAAHADVDDLDGLLWIYATGRNGSTYLISSQIQMDVDGTPGSGYVPGKIVFRVNNGQDTGPTPSVAMTIRSGGHIEMENTLAVENQVTAEAFYVKTGGEVRPWNVNSDHFYISQDADGTNIINLRHETFTKSITLQNPSNFDTVTWWVEPEETEVMKMTAFLRTEDSGFYPFCDFTVRYGSFPSRGAGTELEVGGWRAGFYTGHAGTGENPLYRSVFDNNVIPQDSFLWLETLKLGEGDGKEEELHVTLQLRKN